MRTRGTPLVFGLILATTIALPARTLLTSCPEASIEIDDDCQATALGANTWVARTVDGNAEMAFSIQNTRHENDRGTADGLIETTQAGHDARIVAESTVPAGSRTATQRIFDWKREGTAMRTIVIAVPDGGHRYLLRLTAPRDFIDIYQPEFLQAVDTLRIGPDTTYVLRAVPSAGIRFPVPRGWAVQDTACRSEFRDGTHENTSSVGVEFEPARPSDQPQVIAATVRLYEQLARNPEFTDLQVLGKFRPNGLEAVTLVAQRKTGKATTKDFFIQIARPDGVASIHLELCKGGENRWSEYAAELLAGIESLDNTPSSAAAGVISGVVRTSQGLAAARVRVSLHLVSETDGAAGAIVAETSTDFSGRYAFEANVQRRYMVCAGDSLGAAPRTTGASGRSVIDLVSSHSAEVPDITLRKVP